MSRKTSKTRLWEWSTTYIYMYSYRISYTFDQW